MKKQGLILKSWWFWVVIVVVIGLIIFFFPKSCGGSGGIGGPVTSINCDCFGFVGHDSSMTDAVITNCFGICLKSSCKTTVSPPINPPVEEPVINNTNPPVNPPVNAGVNISFNKSLKFTIKAANPQYRQGQDITILYTLENTGNEILSISPNVVNGIGVKNSGGRILDYTGNNSGVKVLTDTFDINPLQKKTGSFIIKGNDYDLLSNGNPTDGYYNTVTAYIGDVNSNRLILRIIK